MRRGRCTPFSVNCRRPRNDDSGWSTGYAMNVDVVEIADSTILKAKVSPVEASSAYLAHLQARYPAFDVVYLRRLARRHGSRVERVIGDEVRKTDRIWSGPRAREFSKEAVRPSGDHARGLRLAQQPAVVGLADRPAPAVAQLKPGSPAETLSFVDIVEQVKPAVVSISATNELPRVADNNSSKKGPGGQGGWKKKPDQAR